MSERAKTGTATAVVIGLLLTAQGFGSALTEALWDHSFGVAGILRKTGLPGWTDYVVGVAGLALIAWGAFAKRDARPPS
ncbi:hypothetical protein Afil01_02110 [Actinorhabdospora filicis]|uniref:Uncharacterized protein n=1 Tax=Actinorhabdospora filicis TaxID=1785913 RepID=A0A9W6SDU3_9ACTN|nr:hypothetical protein [Actinorhabdospora filicis]GLZ75404.1 hypothetical protein Afil01_02110 [Actinorhabdospora filicis]